MLTNVAAVAMPLKVTDLTPAKPEPLIVTVVPTGPVVGVIEVITGVTVNGCELVVVPVAVVTVIGPVVAHAGTAAVHCVELM